MKNHNKTKSITNDELKITNKTVIRNAKFVIDKGYKQTKIGIIPNDWEVRRLGDVCDKICGEYGANESAVPYSKNLNRYVRITDIDNNGNLLSEKVSALISNEDTQKYKLEKEDLLFARTGATVGKTYLHKDNSETMIYAGFLIRFRLNKKKLLPKIIKEYANTSKYWNWVKAYSARSGQPGINSKEYKSLLLPIPPLTEQKAIADCLTTWDKGIEKLTALITAKKTQKKALMQSIFNNEERIKNWKEVKLGEIAEYRRGSFPQPYGLEKWYDDKNGFPFVQVYDVDKNFKLKSNTKRKISQLATEQSVFIKKGTIIITLQGSIGRVAITQYDAFVDRTLLLFEKFNQPTNKIFFIHILHRLFEREKQKAPGGTIKTITKEVLSNFSITFPPLAEQKEIANLLSTADKEIALLEQKLVALQRQKQGLMQVLLTGQLRIMN